MARIDDAQVTGALEAVAAVDGTPPDMLATMIVEEWLRRHRHRFMLAAEALAGLDGDPHPDLPDDSVTSPGDDTPEAGKDGDAPSGEGQSGTSGPASPGAAPAYACQVDGCTFVGKSKQSLGGHKANAHRTGKKPAKKKAKPTSKMPCDQCDRIFGSAQALSVHVTRSHPEPGDVWDKRGRDPDQAADIPVRPVKTYACAVCKRSVPVVHHVKGLGDCCRDCAKDVA